MHTVCNYSFKKREIGLRGITVGMALPLHMVDPVQSLALCIFPNVPPEKSGVIPVGRVTSKL